MLSIPWNLIKSILIGSINAFETQELNAWCNLSDLNRLVYEEIMNNEVLQERIISGNQETNEDEWNNIVSRLKPLRKEIRLGVRKLRLIASAAAIILLLVGLSSGLIIDKLTNGRFIQTDEYSYVFSPRGQRTKVILPDRTQVWLNAESSLRYSAGFNQLTREVTLEGEAFFEVTKNSNKPFLVNANEIQVKVYGTSFNLKAFPQDEFIETTLINGKLSVIPKEKSNIKGKEFKVNPNEVFVYRKTKSSMKEKTVEGSDAYLPDTKKLERKLPKVFMEKNVDVVSKVSWKEGKLTFKNETFRELAIKLERWYDINIHFENKEIMDYRFTGVFEKETVNQALEALRISSQPSYQYEMIYRDVYLK